MIAEAKVRALLPTEDTFASALLALLSLALLLGAFVSLMYHIWQGDFMKATFWLVVLNTERLAMKLDQIRQ